MSIKVRNQETGQWEEISNTKGDDYVLTQADKQEIANLVPRDSTMSDTSENAVQNKVVKKYVDDKTYEGKWELIEEVTTEVETVFSRDCNLKKIIIIMIFQNPLPQNKNIYIQGVCAGGVLVQASPNFFAKTKYAKYIFNDVNGFKTASAYGGADEYTYNLLSNSGNKREAFTSSNYSRIKTYQEVPSGTKIQLYGVRAKEGEA